MSPKYYLISGFIVVLLTMAISWWEQKKSVKEIFIVFFRVIILISIFLFVLVGLSEFLVYSGIAQDGFIFQRDELIIQREENR